MLSSEKNKENVAEANSVGLKMKFLKTLVLKCDRFNLKTLNEMKKQKSIAFQKGLKYY